MTDVQRWEEKGMEEILSHFTSYAEEITPSQKNAVDCFFGADSIRTRKEIREALQNARDIYRERRHLSALGISPERDPVSLNGLFRFAGHQKETGRASFTVLRLPMTRQLALMDLADCDRTREWLWEREGEIGGEECRPPNRARCYLDSLPEAVRLATGRLCRQASIFEESVNSGSTFKSWDSCSEALDEQDVCPTSTPRSRSTVSAGGDPAERDEPTDFGAWPDRSIGRLSQHFLTRHLIPLRNTWCRVGLFRYWCGLVFEARAQFREATAEYLGALRYGYTPSKVYDRLDRSLTEIETFFWVAEPTSVKAQSEIHLEGQHLNITDPLSKSRMRELSIWIELLATAAGTVPSWLTDFLLNPPSSVIDKMELPCAWAALTSQHLSLPRHQLRRFLENLPLSGVNQSTRHELFRRYYNLLMEGAQARDYSGMIAELDDLRDLFQRKAMDQLYDSLDFHYALAYYAEDDLEASNTNLGRQLDRIPDHRAALALRAKISALKEESALTVH